MKKIIITVITFFISTNLIAQTLHVDITSNEPGKRNILAFSFMPLNVVLSDADISVLQPALGASLKIQSRVAINLGYDFSLFSINNSTHKAQGTYENDEWAIPVGGYRLNHNLNLSGTFYPLVSDKKRNEHVRIGSTGNATVYARVKTNGVRMLGTTLGIIKGLVPIALNAESFYGRKVSGNSNVTEEITADNGLLNVNYTILKLGIITTRITDLTIKVAERNNDEFEARDITDFYLNLLLPLKINIENEIYNAPPPFFNGFDDHYTQTEYSVNNYNEKAKLGFCAGLNYHNYKKGGKVMANFEAGSMPSWKGLGFYIKLGMGISVSKILGS